MVGWGGRGRWGGRSDFSAAAPASGDLISRVICSAQLFVFGRIIRLYPLKDGEVAHGQRLPLMRAISILRASQWTVSNSSSSPLRLHPHRGKLLHEVSKAHGEPPNRPVYHRNKARVKQRSQLLRGGGFLTDLEKDK